MANEKNIRPDMTPNAQTGSAADVEAMMRQFDRESNTRLWAGKPRVIVQCITVAFSLFCIYVTLFGNLMEQTRLSSFIGCLMVIGFLNYPAHRGHQEPNHMPWYDILLMIIGAGAFFYYAFNTKSIVTLNMRIIKDTKYIVIGIAGILVLAELCRRAVGVPVLCVAGFFVVYSIITLWNKGGIPIVTYRLFYGETGILSTPINVCSKYIVVFIIFGAFLERTGISDFFISLANALCGRFAGGPAKVAVVSSALCGMVSGSSVGNTVTTGSVTIPMMKKTGYKSEFAGAVEASASTGGQIMPPIMGAAAFLMAEYIGVPYSNIIVRAILPAILYFLGIFIAVHLEAKKLGLKGIPKDQLPKFSKLAKDAYLLLPLIILVGLVCSNAKTMQFSAAVAIISAIGVGFINNVLSYVRARKAGNSQKRNPVKVVFGLDEGFGPKNIFEALEAGGRGCISVGIACGIAGIVAGCLAVTGLASTILNAIVSIAGSSVLLALFLTMLCCIVLGMGVPTTATYCIMASACAPILIQMGVPTMAAHFFVFYFGIVADITPPVALAAYAGAAIAKGSPMRTGVTATRLAIAGFIIPFVFALSPAMLLIDTVWYEVLFISVTSIVGVFGIAAGLSGWLIKAMTLPERALSLVSGLCLIFPGLLTDAIGLALIVLVYFLQKMRKTA